MLNMDLNEGIIPPGVENGIYRDTMIHAVVDDDLGPVSISGKTFYRKIFVKARSREIGV